MWDLILLVCLPYTTRSLAFVDCREVRAGQYDTLSDCTVEKKRRITEWMAAPKPKPGLTARCQETSP